MAKAVEFRPAARPALEEKQRKLDEAPLAHADAVLNAYRVLQMLHDSNTLDIVRGLLGAGDAVLNESVSVLTSPAAMRSIRNALVLVNLLGETDPQLLHAVADALAPVVKPVSASGEKPAVPSLFALVRRLLSEDVRRALAVGVTFLEGLGRGLGQRRA